MLNVRVKFVAAELAVGLSNGDYHITENATVRQLLRVCEEQSNSTIPPENMKLMLFILNGKSAMLETPITKDGTLHVCRVIIGG